MLQILVQFEYFSTVDRRGVDRGRSASNGDVASAVVARQVTDVDLVLKSDLDGVSCKCDGSNGGDLGIDAGDSGGQEVG